MIYSSSSLTSNSAEDVRKSLATLALIQVTTNEILTVQKQLPQTIGYSIGNAVILKDAFGKSLTLPMDFCFSPDVRRLHAIPICTKVKDGHFIIL